MSSAYERQVSAAESALRRSEKGTPAEASLEVARAQVHATLAVAAATIAARPAILSKEPAPDYTRPTPRPDDPFRIAPLDIDPDAFERE